MIIPKSLVDSPHKGPVIQKVYLMSWIHFLHYWPFGCQDTTIVCKHPMIIPWEKVFDTHHYLMNGRASWNMINLYFFPVPCPASIRSTGFLSDNQRPSFPSKLNSHRAVIFYRILMVILKSDAWAVKNNFIISIVFADGLALLLGHLWAQWWPSLKLALEEVTLK